MMSTSPSMRWSFMLNWVRATRIMPVPWPTMLEMSSSMKSGGE